MKFLKNTYSTLLASMALAVAAVGCSDELDYPHSTVEPGLPATISVNVSLPEMTPITRADMVEGLDSKVESLWIGVFASSGALTGSKTVTGGEMNPHDTKVTVTDIDAKTGLSYIVAVANYKDEDTKFSVDGKSFVTFEEALKEVNDYNTFKNISIAFNKTGDVFTGTPTNALLMSGHYIEGDHKDADGKESGRFTAPIPVEIKENTTLTTGSIHLRRLISQVKFNVTYNKDKIKEFRVLSYQIKNVPNQSWLYESTSDTINAGDNRQVGTSKSYQDSKTFDQVNNIDGNWSFDWWQFENKRKGLDPEDVYDPEDIDKDISEDVYKSNDYYMYRELEHKTNGINSGQYRSLVKTKSDDLDKVAPSNNATFVEMKVRMTMSVNEKDEPLDTGQQRVVDATYTIHLGYCEGSGKDKAMDFNSRRNSKYEYKVTIDNVKKILLEAKQPGETQPGAEGSISDVSVKYVELDAHYGVYKIYLSSSELTPSTNNEDKSGFRYIIECYDGKNSKNVTIDSDNKNNKDDSKFYKWIEISRDPIDADSKLADGTWTKASLTKKLTKYKDKEYREAKGFDNVYDIKEFKEAIDKGELKDKPGWYTIFFNEYVYDDDDWWTYVNKPDRTVRIRVREDMSDDKESTHYVANYVFSQQSIQTYYSTLSGNRADIALGVERENESFGLNLCNSFNSSYNESKNNVSTSNGRYNTNLYFSTKGWATVLADEYQEVQAINNKTVGVENIPAKTVASNNPVPLPAIISVSKPYNRNTDYDPDNTSGKYYEAISACINRNRDLDGDGKITSDELRWYVPTTNQYTQIVLGSQSLAQPLYNFKDKSDIKEGDPNKNMSKFIYGSNGKVLWSFEGLSTSNWTGTWEKNGTTYDRPQYTMGAAWEVRCVRNLGVKSINNDINKVPGEVYAKEYEDESAGEGLIRMHYYDTKSTRDTKMKKTYPHVISDEVNNSVYKGAFKYKLKSQVLATKYSGLNYTYYTSEWTGGDKKSNRDDWVTWLGEDRNPCDVYNINGESGWRVPNQKELTILMTMGVATGGNTLYDISGTFAQYFSDGTNYLNVNSFNKTVKVNGKDENETLKVMSVRRDDNENIDGCQQTYSIGHYLRCVKDVD